ncbi:VCBS repeat-containing protein [Robiginitalea sp. IMCC43444]|uniref:VCBS repeat-containing protein n=1 Tax=Robiginitalea sp. IMCC43444 TaxID=3459121 RepID=UPI0040419433
MRILLIGIAFCLLLGGCAKSDPPVFREMAPTETGITFKNQLTETPDLNILTYLYYYNGAGVAAADFNNDGLIDLYFTANQGADAFYLNKGSFRFEEVSSKANIINSKGWTTGVTHADVNGDGLQDIYICKASGYRSLEGRNLLFVNQGNNEKGIPVFKEMAEGYGLDFSGLSTQAAFFDYDLDGDLDMFLLNHSVHPNRNYGKGSQRSEFDALAGDRLFRNDGDTFTDVSREAGIYQGKAGYGLGIGISDLNNDGYPDIYISNDFFENDYLYFNRRDGTFQEVISKETGSIGHTSHFSMGNDISDINNDGLPDILSLDMLPEDLITYKTSGLEYPFPIYRQYLNNGFAPQYMQNTLQLNMGGEQFSEIAELTGLAATEWSWGALIEDFDNDGLKDVFISNGIKGATNDMDYMNFIANEAIQRRIDRGMNTDDLPLTQEIPPKKVSNYFYRNNGGLTFTDNTEAWIGSTPSYSNGCSYADLDQDGDLDLIVNQVDAIAAVYENTSQNASGISVRLKGSGNNSKGIGAKILAYSGDTLQFRENFSSRGYLSAVPTQIHIGLGTAKQLDSLLVVWPGGAYEKIQSVPSGNKLILYEDNAGGNYYTRNPKGTPWQVNDSLLPFRHRENISIDFDREPLIAFANSNEGPDISVADFNKDGLDDLFISGAKNQASSLFLQQSDGSFAPLATELLEEDALSEDTSQAVFDANGDSWPDILVVSGGNEFQQGKALQPRLYLNLQGKTFQRSESFPDIEANASRVGAHDIDRDGDLDVFISSDGIAGNFGKNTRHFLLENDGLGNFTDVTEKYLPGLQDYGNIQDFIWQDLNGDELVDLIVIGHWNAPAVYLNKAGQWELQEDSGLEAHKGLWNTVKVADIDQDGDLDILGGNWGLNSKLEASPKEPLTLYRYDFDQNGSIEPLVTYYHKGIETPFASKDELVKQMPFLNKKYRTYNTFARAKLQDLFGREALSKADQKKVTDLASCLFINDGNGKYHRQRLPLLAQASVIYDFALDDFDQDGKVDLLPVGNHHQLNTQLGRLDGLNGLILINQGNARFKGNSRNTIPLSGAARNITSLVIKGEKTYVIGRNDDSPVFFRMQ